MSDCIFCGKPTTDGTAHWACGGILPGDPRHAAISAADHVVRLLTPKRTQDASAGTKRAPAPAMTTAELRAKLRPVLAEHLDDGLALAVEVGAVRATTSGRYELAPQNRSPRPARDDGTEPGLFELPEGTTSR